MLGALGNVVLRARDTERTQLQWLFLGGIVLVLVVAFMGLWAVRTPPPTAATPQ